jgi:hypothetical protein
MSQNGRKLTPAQALALLEQHVKSDEIEQKLAAMTNEELDEALAKEGVTEAKLASIAEADHALAVRLGYVAPETPAPSNVRDIREARLRSDVTKRRWPTWVPVVTMVGAIAATVTLFFALAHTDNLPNAFRTPAPTATATGAGTGTGTGVEPGAPLPERVPELTLPHYYRLYAFGLCFGGKDDECIRYLDAAQALDPGGDVAPNVQAARRLVALMREQQHDH